MSLIVSYTCILKLYSFVYSFLNRMVKEEQIDHVDKLCYRERTHISIKVVLILTAVRF